MHRHRERLWLPLCLMIVLVTSVAAFAQGAAGRTLVSGTPITGVLDSSNIAQIYSLEGDADEAFALTATNTAGVPLAIVVTDALGDQVAQAIDEDVDGELVLESIVLPAAGTYYVTVFKSGGVNAVSTVEFTLVVDALPAAGTSEPEATAEATAVATVIAEQTAVPESTDVVDTTVDSGQVVTTGGIQVSLSWNTVDDLDLEVRDPVGGSLYWETPTVDSGGTISANANQGCANTNANPPTETATWSPGGVPTGSYEVLVYFQQACAGETPVTFTLTPIVDGVTLNAVEATLLTGQVYAASFEVAPDGSAVLNPQNGIVEVDDLPAAAADLLATAAPITIGSTVNGTISNEQPYQSYSFEGNANDLVSVTMTAQSGSLDTYVALLDASGSVIRFNDDLGVGFTDSALNTVLLPSAGTYTIVASRYAKELGGTEGNYVLTLQTQATNLSAEFTNLPLGSLEIRLIWPEGVNADLQLLVRDPSGDAVYDDVPQIRGGGQLAAAGNVNCTVPTGTPFSYIYWPETIAPRAGSYEVEVWFQNDCGDTVTPVRFNLYINYNGQEVFTDSASPQLNQRYLTSFNIAADGSVQPGQGGIIQGIQDLDYSSEMEDASVIEEGLAVNGSITPDNKFDLYTFTGAAGDIVNINIRNTGGTLDTYLYLIGPSGTVVSENDDAVAGENTNSLIGNLTLPEDGQYIIIATHFGGVYGGTTGTYQLTYSQQS